MPAWEGRCLRGRYSIERRLGEGADAVVYRARDEALARLVAVKLLRPERCAEPTVLERFTREARAAARLDHPAIVPVYDCGEVDGVPFLVMAYLAGGDLRARLAAGGPWPVAAALRLATEVADALAAAHAAGIVHRDVKPSNILLTPDGHARLADFGIAKVLQAPALSQTRAVLGTPYYLAPEQASGGPITPATDVYALGVVLFELLTGRRPFEGDEFVAVALQHLRQLPPAPSALNPAVPAPVETVVLRALAKDPAARFPDGAAFADALRALRAPAPAASHTARLPPVGAALADGAAAAGVAPTEQLRLAATQRAPAPASHAAPRPPRGPRGARWPRDARHTVGAAIGLATLGLLLVASLLGRAGHEPPPPVAAEAAADPRGDAPALDGHGATGTPTATPSPPPASPTVAPTAAATPAVVVLPTAAVPPVVVGPLPAPARPVVVPAPEPPQPRAGRPDERRPEPRERGPGRGRGRD